MIDLPYYQSIKIVQGAKITGIAYLTDENDRPRPGSHVLVFGEIGQSLCVPQSYIDRHKPSVDDYYVVYEDGYASCSPPKAFKKGNVLIQKDKHD